MMRQQVNLYLPEFRPRRERLDSRTLLWLALAAVVLMALVSGRDYWRWSRMNDELSALQEQARTQARETGALEQRLAARSAGERLQQELESRQAQLQRSRELLDFLQDTALGNVDGFSAQLKDLSRASFEGLWLEEIRLDEGGSSVYLRGMARQSAMVPDFIARLGNGSSRLGRQHFHRFLGSRPAPDTQPDAGVAGPAAGAYEFVLETQ